MGKIKLLFLVAVSAFALSGCKKSPSPMSLEEANFDDHQVVTVAIGNTHQLKLEVVNTPQSTAQGLSGRDELGADGMLFVFEQSRTPQFWMKEMKFDLDIIWIDQQRIIEITQGVPAPALGTPLSELPTYSPKQPVTMVLEVEAGKATEWQLAIGDLVLIE